MEDIQNEEVEVELEDDSELLESDESDLEEQLKRKDDIIRQLNARAKKAEALSKKREPLKTNDEDDGLSKTVAELKFAEQKRQYGYSNNLSPDEVDYIFKVNNEPTKELLEDPFIKGGLEAIRTQKRIDNNTPSTTSRSPRFEVPTKENLTPQDKQENFEKWRDERFKK